MKDIYNIVKVSDIDDVDLTKIIRKCNDTPNLISYYYPHIFMNRDKINKADLEILIKQFTDSIKRDKNVDHTLKKYNVISNIIETLFLCIFDLNNIKNFQRYIQLNISNNEHIITDILNLIIQNKPINNLEAILNNKIDISNCVFIIEKIIDHIKKDYKDDCLEKNLLTQFQLITHVQKYLSKYKYNPYLLKIFNMNKFELLQNYVSNCVVNESHDEYLGNIFEIFENVNKCDDLSDQQIDWIRYVDVISKSLNIDDSKEKVIKSILRISFLDKVISSLKNQNYKNGAIMHLQTLIETNKIDKIISNTYINMVKTNAPFAKLEVIEHIIKYFKNFGILSNELIKLIMPKYFCKDDIKYYLDIIYRLNTNISTGKKLHIIESIIEQQKDYENKKKNATLRNTSGLPFEASKLSTYCIDNRFVEPNCEIKQDDFVNDIKGYVKFTKVLFDREIFENLKNVTVHNYLSNGVVKFGNTEIHTNMLILNVLFLFNNPSKSVSIHNIKQIIKDDNVVDDIIHTLEYYNIIKKNDEKKNSEKKDNSSVIDFITNTIFRATEVINLNTTFFDKKQEIKIELIKKAKIPIVEKPDDKMSDSISISEQQPEYLRYDVIECFILKTIKPAKVNKNDLKKIVEEKCKFSITSEGFNKCVARLFKLDYFEYQGEEIVYVP